MGWLGATWFQHIYINKLAVYLEQSSALALQDTEVTFQLYADDLIVLKLSEQGPQQQQS